MSSTLDDLEPYEFFQDDLDRWLENYKKMMQLTTSELYFINAFIEYVCSCKFCSSKEEILRKEIKEEFIKYIEVGFRDTYDQAQLTKSMEGFLNFIHSL